MRVQAICSLHGHILLTDPSDACLNCNHGPHRHGFCRHYRRNRNNATNPFVEMTKQIFRITDNDSEAT